MKPENYFSADEFQRIWKEEFLILSIRQEIKEMQMLKASIGLIKDRCDTLQKSQDFISNKYDTIVETFKTSKNRELSSIRNTRKLLAHLKRNKQSWWTQLTFRGIKKISARDCRKSNKIG